MRTVISFRQERRIIARTLLTWPGHTWCMMLTCPFDNGRICTPGLEKLIQSSKNIHFMLISSNISHCARWCTVLGCIKWKNRFFILCGFLLDLIWVTNNKKTFSCLLLQLWQFGLSSFQGRVTKLARILAKNQCIHFLDSYNFWSTLVSKEMPNFWWLFAMFFHKIQ
mgnify:CR=1 FL=1